jgi:hypothetical protein
MIELANRYFPVLFCYLCATSGEAGAGFSKPVSDVRTISVSITNASCDHRNKPAFDWEITNPAGEPVFIYSTFLKGQSAGSTLDESLHLYTIWTSLPKEADYSVNDYRPAMFVSLKSGETLKGRFVEYPGVPDTCAECGKVPRGATNLEFAVAFGWETDSVKKELRDGGYVHPANPIVHWQQIAKSAPAPLRGCKS